MIKRAVSLKKKDFAMHNYMNPDRPSNPLNENSINSAAAFRNSSTNSFISEILTLKILF